MSHIISFSCPRKKIDIIDILKKIANENDESFSDLVIRALEAYLEKVEKVVQEEVVEEVTEEVNDTPLTEDEYKIVQEYSHPSVECPNEIEIQLPELRRRLKEFGKLE